MTSTILLDRLQSQDTAVPNIPLPTLQSVLSHHLSIAPSTSTTTSMTVSQLTATAISSPFFHPGSQAFDYTKLQAFETAFRHSVHLLRPQRSKKGDPNHLNISRWTGDIIKGVQGGHPILRLAACGGILLGIEDLKNNADGIQTSITFSQTLVESETVVALAEVLDSTTVHTEWEHEFQHHSLPHHPSQNTLLQAFILASHSLPLVDSKRLTALPLHILAQLLMGTLASFFKLPDPDPSSQTKSIVIADVSHVASLAKLTSVIFSALLDSTNTRTYTRTLITVSDAFNTLLDLSKIIEQTYSVDPSNETAKQFLFTTLIISQAVLSSIVYLPPQLITHPGTGITPSSLALITLQTLTHLSLVIAQFGGITKAFEQLKQVFYLSADIILAPSPQKNQNAKGKEKEYGNEYFEVYVQDLSHFLQSQSPEMVTTLPFRAKLSFALSVFEQLVPVLSPRCIIDYVWDVCYPQLANSPEFNREIYESAHSVVLSILVHDSQRRQESTLRSLFDHEDEILWSSFIQRLVVFYAKCLVEDVMLTVSQLRHAYSSLVQCASVLSTHPDPTQNAQSNTAALALPWYCVQLVLDTIDALASASSPQSLVLQPLISKKDRLHRLHLILISTLPFLPLESLHRGLDRVRDVLIEGTAGVEDEEQEKDEERKRELIQTLFESLTEQMDGEGKAVGMKWWYENLELVHKVVGREDETKEGIILRSRL